MRKFNEAKEARNILKIGILLAVTIAAIATPGLRLWLRILLLLGAGWIYFNSFFIIDRISTKNRILSLKELSSLVERDSIKN
ncbi:MAG: hypothetical protein ACYDAO_05840 [Thermoplasmataceae archaeon]